MAVVAVTVVVMAMVVVVTVVVVVVVATTLRPPVVHPAAVAATRTSCEVAQPARVCVCAPPISRGRAKHVVLAKQRNRAFL